jgi:hypothetical protein
LTELIKDEKWQEIFTMFGLEQPPSVPAELFTRGHGLVEASVCHFSPDECAKVRMGFPALFTSFEYHLTSFSRGVSDSHLIKQPIIPSDRF